MEQFVAYKPLVCKFTHVKLQLIELGFARLVVRIFGSVPLDDLDPMSTICVSKAS